MAVAPTDVLPSRAGVRWHQSLTTSWRSYAVLAAISSFLLALLIVPVGAVFVTAFRDGDA